jgi:hypothetical protein
LIRGSKLNLDQAKAIIQKCGSIYCYGYWIREFCLDQKLINSEWLNFKRNLLGKNSWNVPSPSLDKETTYDGCVESKISIQNDVAVIELTMWDGDLCDGSRTYKRCLFRYELISLNADLERILNFEIERLALIKIKEWEDKRIALLKKRVMAAIKEELGLED